MMTNLSRCLVSIVTLAASTVWAQDGGSAAATPKAGETTKVTLKDLKGKSVGTVTLQDTPHGLLLKGDLKGLPAGTHAIHIHEVGKCEAPFKTAGGHFNPSHKEHGMMNAGGEHAGDMPNIVVPANGQAKFELLAPDASLASGPNTVYDDADGSAIVIHAKADDYVSQPAGNAGDRIACGVISK